MIIHYQYKTYPCSRKATAYSRALGILTCWLAKLLFLFLINGLFIMLFTAWGMEGDACFWLALIPSLAALYPYGILKRLLQRKIDRIALKDFAMNNPEILQKLEEFMHAGE